MILDPTHQYIQAISAQVDLIGATVLEIGCGTGRITRDLAQLAGKIVATDLDNSLILKAKQLSELDNVEFLHTPEGLPQLPPGSFDLVIYTLSLHHIPTDRMREHLLHSGTLLKEWGKIIVVEPGNSGSFLRVKQRFGAGSGDEGPEKAAAIAAMRSLTTWTLTTTSTFNVDFLFTDKEDFLSTKLPHYKNLSAEILAELDAVLENCRTPEGIVLSSERLLNVIEPAVNNKK
ncbi:MAG: class I SAM-dependent methyltransferase [Desulfuromonadales bacterium]|nr:class I SAM-dependent methyltransferase [Desulfuromonadales bacterium]MBN2791789.1 class I SAM-dependent methyltransferase [Desulfuromonadales bacterium]